MAEPLRTDTKISLLVIDAAGKEHLLNGPVCDGRPFLPVREGLVEYVVSFSQLSRGVVLRKEGKDLVMRLTFKDGREEEVRVSADTFCRASSPIGRASFYLKDIKEIQVR